MSRTEHLQGAEITPGANPIWAAIIDGRSAGNKDERLFLNTFTRIQLVVVKTNEDGTRNLWYDKVSKFF